MPSLIELESQRRQFLARCQPGQKSRYNGVIQPPRGGEEIRVVPTLCGRCQGYGRVGEELFCPVCKGACYTQPDDAYEPYYADDVSAIHRSLLSPNRSYADRSRHPAHPAHPPQVAPATGVRTRTAGRSRVRK